MSDGLEYGTGRARGTAPVRSNRRLRNGFVLCLPIAVASLAIGTACIDASVPLAPDCLTGIQIELSTEQIMVGESFEATATSRSDECLSNLMWSAFGVISLDAAEGSSATFHAADSGNGTIRVMNDSGNLGVIEVSVEESEEREGASRGN